MKTEKCCGAVVFTRQNDTIKYVIIKSIAGIYGFPKGHTEEGESEAETALREVREEVGLNVSLIEGFKTEDSHPFTRNGETIMKNIVYFLAEYSDQTPVYLKSVHLMNFETALSVLQFESSKRILTEAHSFLK